MERDFALRVSNKGMDRVRAEWKAFGPEGAASLRVIDAASTKVTPSLKAVDDAARGIRERFNQLAGQVPVIGGFLQALGPAGIAAGVGITAVGMSIAGLARSARQAIEDVGALKDAADTLLISAENLQGLRAEGLLAGIKPEVMDKAMQTLAINSARASEGFGKMKAALEKVSPELGKALANTENQSQRFAILAQGIRAAATENEKLNIATAAFGGDGAQMIRVVDQAGASLEGFAAKARAAGLVLSEDTVTRIEELGDRIAELQAKQKVAEQRMALAYAPAIEKTEEAKLGFINFIADLGELHKKLEEQDEGFIRRQLENARRISETASGFMQARLTAEANLYQAELDRRQAELDRRDVADAAGRGRAISSANSSWADYVTGNRAAEIAEQKVAVEKAALEAARLAAEQLREQQALEKQAIAIRKEAGDWSGVYAQKVAELDAVVGKYGVTQEMVNAILLKYRHELDGTADAQARYTALMEGQKSAVDKIHDRMAQARLDERSGGITPEQLRQEMAALNSELEAAVAAANPAADAIDKLATAQERAKDITFEHALSMDTMSSILRGQMNDWKDWEDVALNALYNVAMRAIDTQAKIKQNSTLGDFAGAVLGAFGFGGGLAGAGVKQMHGGGLVGDPSLVGRTVPMAMFANAPRFHSGLAPDEFPTILQRGERVLSASHNERMVRAIETGGGGGNVNVVIRDETGAKFDASASRNANGDIDLEIFVRQGAAKGAASGDLDTVMLGRYGIPRKVN